MVKEVVELADDKTEYKLKYTGEQVEKLLDEIKKISSFWNTTSRNQFGCVNVMSGFAGTDVTKQINFGAEFDKDPNIIIMPRTYGNKKADVSVMSVSTTGFKIKLNSDYDDTNTDVYWMAMGL